MIVSTVSAPNRSSKEKSIVQLVSQADLAIEDKPEYQANLSEKITPKEPVESSKEKSVASHAKQVIEAPHIDFIYREDRWTLNPGN